MEDSPNWAIPEDWKNRAPAHQPSNPPDPVASTPAQRHELGNTTLAGEEAPLTLEKTIKILASVVLWVSPFWLLFGVFLVMNRQLPEVPPSAFWCLYAPIVSMAFGFFLLILHGFLVRLSRIADAMEALNGKVK